MDGKRIGTGTAEGEALARLLARMRATHLAGLFDADPQRFSRFSRHACGLLLDVSKQRLDQPVFDALMAFARARGVPAGIQALFAGEHVNWTEDRPAMHWRLRGQARDVPEVHEQLERMEKVVDKVLSGHWRGCQGDAITDVVNLGVGGSDLGPLMASCALQDLQPEGERPEVHFVSAMDGSQIAPLLRRLDPSRTLIIISSKSFTTADTMGNAATARDWLTTAFPGREEAILKCHFVGVSANPGRMSDWGIHPGNQLLFWDWVGGRYSLWSAIGLPIALTVGMDAFRDMLAGARCMDEHFADTALENNLPVIMAMVDIWNINFLDITARAVLPYDGRLKHFPAYLEQLEMESNGKSLRRDGSIADYHTCPVIWGEIGSNAQHAFYQLLHQGTQPVACDFIVAARPGTSADDGSHAAQLARQHQSSLANCLAQSRLLALGEKAFDDGEPLPAFKHYHGNQPSSLLLLETLSPWTLGALIALYEHKVFVESLVWEINPFDQWGVEMGKVSAGTMLAVLRGEKSADGLDVSTRGLTAFIRDQGRE